MGTGVGRVPCARSAELPLNWTFNTQVCSKHVGIVRVGEKLDKNLREGLVALLSLPPHFTGSRHNDTGIPLGKVVLPPFSAATCLTRIARGRFAKATPHRPMEQRTSNNKHRERERDLKEARGDLEPQAGSSTEIFNGLSFSKGLEICHGTSSALCT